MFFCFLCIAVVSCNVTKMLWKQGDILGRWSQIIQVISRELLGAVDGGKALLNRETKKSK